MNEYLRILEIYNSGIQQKIPPVYFVTSKLADVINGIHNEEMDFSECRQFTYHFYDAAEIMFIYGNIESEYDDKYTGSMYDVVYIADKPYYFIYVNRLIDRFKHKHYKYFEELIMLFNSFRSIIKQYNISSIGIIESYIGEILAFYSYESTMGPVNDVYKLLDINPHHHEQPYIAKYDEKLIPILQTMKVEEALTGKFIKDLCVR